MGAANIRSVSAVAAVSGGQSAQCGRADGRNSAVSCSISKGRAYGWAGSRGAREILIDGWTTDGSAARSRAVGWLTCSTGGCHEACGRHLSNPIIIIIIIIWNLHTLCGVHTEKIWFTIWKKCKREPQR